ncbi:DNA polymerase III subunit gamma/tau [Paludibacteraceae bacterium OttesenSCG-928-F17]|nr:DNA polymerase III subunit gamma/tau [Paludibacteraceae bacterium OttesenSCG-928-F17]
MNDFVVSARKYRPSTFNSVVGQASLTTTLKNAIKNNHLAHAYLFCGPRGVGKTTCARIFAKTINCQNLTADFEACNECESCKSFNEQRSYNIHELDAASNNGVDDIRSLIEQVRIPPQIGKYSVYIIDEVHMLSQGAFNAFLKTLEEPPAHAIFILATTEKHKIIPTILSRTQIYDFNRITIADTVEHLKYVAQQESVTADENALNIIAQKSDGGMRDALSIFDQIVSYSGNNITYQHVIENLNVLDYEYYFKLVDALLENKVSEALLIFDEILNKGFDAHHFITGLSSHIRDILVSKDLQTVQLLEVGADIRDKYLAQAQRTPVDFLFQALKVSNDCDLNYRISKNKRLLVELALIRLCQITDEKKKLTDEQPAPILKITPEKEVKNNPVETNQPAKENIAASPKAEEEPVNKEAPTTRIKAPEKKTVTAPPPERISISLNNRVAEKKEEYQKEQQAVQEEMNAPYTENELQKIWLSFTETIPENVRLVSFMKTNLPRIIQEDTFEVTVSNVLQEKELLASKQEILAFLRGKLKNSSIAMTIKMSEANEDYKILTTEDKYKMMIAQNPALAKLRNNLGLELD